jgi:hypothetical protein
MRTEMKMRIILYNLKCLLVVHETLLEVVKGEENKVERE